MRFERSFVCTLEYEEDVKPICEILGSIVDIFLNRGVE
jgi:hypothetical protein